MTHKVLIVEDEVDIRELIHFHLYKQNYEVLEASDGEQALSLCEKHSPDLIILDIMLPKLDGLEVCKKIKSSGLLKDARIIFLTAKGEEEDILKGLELGADDYITKPFSPKILLAKIKAVLNRSTKKHFDIISEQGVKLDLVRRKAFVNDTEVSLTVTEYSLLKHLLSSPGQVYTRAQIVNAIKGDNHAVTDRSVDTQLVSLRKKLREKGRLIETVWGIGYRFKENEN